MFIKILHYPDRCRRCVVVFVKAIDAIDYLRRTKEVGQSVAIVGGGLTGCEIAYELALQGKSPFVVKMMDDVVKVVGVNAANSMLLRTLLEYHKVPLYLESRLKEIRDGSVVVHTEAGEKEIPADSVIISIGYNAGASGEGQGQKRACDRRRGTGRQPEKGNLGRQRSCDQHLRHELLSISQ